MLYQGKFTFTKTPWYIEPHRKVRITAASFQIEDLHSVRFPISDFPCSRAIRIREALSNRCVRLTIHRNMI